MCKLTVVYSIVFAINISFEKQLLKYNTTALIMPVLCLYVFYVYVFMSKHHERFILKVTAHSIFYYFQVKTI